jgi:hypothetical protein
MDRFCLADAQWEKIPLSGEKTASGRLAGISGCEAICGLRAAVHPFGFCAERFPRSAS